uniref:Uncharacterized protein n=1 Tax=Xenopus tropicalis TaxID=8364 RepID=A0A1B8XSD8_XENTR
MPSQSSKSLGKDGLKPWLSHAQPEFQEPGEGRAALEFQEPGERRAEALAILCPARVQGAWGRTGGLMSWLSHAQPEFQEPGKGRSSRSLGKDGLKPWLSHAQPEFKEPVEGRADALAISCPARVQGAWGRTG